MPSDTSLTLRFEGLTILAECGSAAHREWLREFLVPDFEESATNEIDCRVDVIVDSSLYAEVLGVGGTDGADHLDCFALDSSVVRLPILHRDGSVTTVSDAPFESVYTIDSDLQRVTILTHGENARVRASLLRVVREFAMNALHGCGLFLHASALEVGGAGVAFAGQKAAGKTTMLTYLLGHGVGSYLSNDRVYVADRETVPIFRNVPTVISVRPGTLELCARFRDRLMDSGFATYLETLREAALSGPTEVRTNAFGNYFLSPAQFRTLLGASQQTSADAAALVFPVIDDRVATFELRPLVVDESMARIAQALLGAGTWRKGRDAFTIPVERPAPPYEALEVRARRFFEKVRCFELRLGPRAYADRSLADAIASLAKSQER